MRPLRHSHTPDPVRLLLGFAGQLEKTIQNSPATLMVGKAARLMAGKPARLMADKL